LIYLFAKSIRSNTFIIGTVGSRFIRRNTFSRVRINNYNPRIIKRSFFDIIAIHLHSIELETLLSLVEQTKHAWETSDIVNNSHVTKFLTHFSNPQTAESFDCNIQVIKDQVDNIRRSENPSNIPSGEYNIVVAELNKVENNVEKELVNIKNVINTIQSRPNFHENQLPPLANRGTAADPITALGRELADLVTKTNWKK
jgi:hypothetical protein